MFKNIRYLYIMKHLETTEPDFGYLDACDFFMEACLPMDYIVYHLKVPKLNDKILFGMNNKQYEFEVVLEGDGESVRLYVVMIDSRLKRSQKLRKLKEKICQR